MFAGRTEFSKNVYHQSEAELWNVKNPFMLIAMSSHLLFFIRTLALSSNTNASGWILPQPV